MKHVLLATLAAATLFSVPANADLFNTGRTCGSSELRADGTTTCFGDVRVRFVSNGPENYYAMRVVAPSSHCSAVRYTVRLPRGSGYLARSLWLEPGQEETIELGENFAAGSHNVLVSAEGRVGGCNAGRMDSWKLGYLVFDYN